MHCYVCINPHIVYMVQEAPDGKYKFALDWSRHSKLSVSGRQ